MIRSFFFILFPLFTFLNLVKKPLSDTTSKKIELTISFPGKEKIKSCRDIVVFIINHTNSVASFFEDWNEWGYFNIGFWIKTKTKVYSLNKKLRDWTKNYPSYKTLFPGDTLRFEFTLNVQDFNCTTYSDFDGVIPSNDTSATITAFYHLNSGTLEQANDFPWKEKMIKYKEIFKENKEKGSGEWIIVDSLKEPVEARKTFPLEELESGKYKLN